MPLVLPVVAPLNYSPCQVLNVSGVVEEWTEKTKWETSINHVREEQQKKEEGETRRKEQMLLI